MTSAWLMLVLAQTGRTVGSGRIVGGWEYVWAAYGLTWAGVCLYALTLWLRRKASTSTEITKEPS